MTKRPTEDQIADAKKARLERLRKQLDQARARVYELELHVREAERAL